MNEDKNYQLYVDAKKKLVKERLGQAKEYLAEDIVALIHSFSGELRHKIKKEI